MNKKAQMLGPTLPLLLFFSLFAIALLIYSTRASDELVQVACVSLGFSMGILSLLVIFDDRLTALEEKVKGKK